jgi:ABC-2 type transport system permease protein
MTLWWLQTRSELWKLFGKKRTFIGFIVFILAQNLILALLRFSNASRGFRRVIEGNGYLFEEYLSALTFATTVAFSMAYLLMPLYLALVGGDMVAKEHEDGTLRMILSRPISRVRLLFIKWMVALFFAMVLVLALAVIGYGTALLYFPNKSLFVMWPGSGGESLFGLFPQGEGLVRYLGAHAVLMLKAATVTSLAFMFSCFNAKPAAASILALSVLLVNAILSELPFLSDSRHWFLHYYLNTWQLIFADPIPWPRIVQSAFVLAGVNVTAWVVGATYFQLRDIKS